MRINKYLAECGVCSRRKADELVKQGRVSVNKKVVYEVGTDINEEKDVVFVDGKKVVKVTHYDYLLFYKPKGCVTTLNEDNDNKSGRKKTASELEAEEKRNAKAVNRVDDNAQEPVSHTKPRKIITDYIGDDYKNKRLYPVGRLDYDSEGLLLLTNDGNVTYKLTHPSSEIPKTYIVKIEGAIEESDLAILRKGVTVDGVKYARCKVKVTGIEKVSANNKKSMIDAKDPSINDMYVSDSDRIYTRLEVIIFEGKNREIRRMFSAVEKNVVFLKRVAIGDLRLGGLARGTYRPLNENEIAYLLDLCSRV